MFHKKRKGFTLLELMIVVLVLGILAGLALPRFITATNKAKESEAKDILASIRASQLRYKAYSDDSTYADEITDLDLSYIGGGNYSYSASNGATIGKAATSVSGLKNYQITPAGVTSTY